MDVMWLRVFREVARTGSFTAAAVPLGFTQSAVSRQVSALEHEVGAVLFDRLPRGVRLTASGRALLAHADAVLDRLDLAQRDLQALADLTAGRLAVGAFSTAEVALVPRALAAFTGAYPRVAVELAEGTSPQQVGRVRSGAIDVAVVSSTGGAALDDAQVELHLLMHEPLLVALPRDALPRDALPRDALPRDALPGGALPSGARLGGGRVRLADLAEEAWIAGAEDPEATLLADAVRGGFRPSVRYVAQEWTAKLGLVAAGLGVTLVPALAASGVRADVVLARLDQDDMPPRAVHAATGRGAALSPPARIFLDLLRRGAADLVREWRDGK